MKTLKAIPLKLKIVIVLCYIIPVIIHFPKGYMESIWNLLVIPTIIFSYYFGLRGGILSAILNIALYGSVILLEYVNQPITYNPWNINVFIFLSITLLVTAIGTGLLADKLKKLITALESQKNELVDLNIELQSYWDETQRILENIGATIWSRDLLQRKFIFSSKENTVFGCSLDEILNDSNRFEETFRKDIKHLSKYFTENLSSTVKTLERKIVRKDGQERWIRDYHYAVMDAENHPIKINGVILDITKQKNLEKNLRESEQRYRALVELSPLPVVVQKQGTIEYVNQAAARFFNGAGLGEVTGQTVFDFFGSNDLAIVNNRIEKAIKEGPQVAEQSIKLNDKAVDVLLATTAIPLDGDTAIITVFQDITEQKQAEEATKRYHEILSREMELAAKVQKNMLPMESPQVAGLKFAWEFKPSTFISGDMFNIFILDENLIGVYMLDVMGHGLAAALQAVSINFFFQHSFSQSINDDNLLKPSNMLKILNKVYIQHSVSGKFFTIFYALIDTETMNITYARAGHPAPLVISKKGEINELNNGGLPVGLFEDSDYDDYNYQLKSEDKLILYTDGLELINELPVKETILKLFEANKNLKIDLLVKSLMNETNRVNSDIDEDDIALMGIEIDSF